MASNISGKKQQTIYLVSPPPMFTYLDSKLSSCCGPLSKGNFTFFKSVGIEKLINYSGKRLDTALVEFSTTISIPIQDVNINDQDFPRSSVSKFTEWLTYQVVSILTQSVTQNLVIYGSLDNHISSLIIACIRKQSDWSILSIFSEFRQFTWPYKMRDYEQLIESFHPTVLEINATEFDQTLKQVTEYDEEESRIEVDAAESFESTEPAAPQPLNDALRSLFLSTPHTKLIWDDTSFDPSISLVNDKDDDD